MAAGARITAPATAGSTAATPRSSNASRACRASMDFASQIRTLARVTAKAGAGTCRRPTGLAVTARSAKSVCTRSPASPPRRCRVADPVPDETRRNPGRAAEGRLCISLTLDPGYARPYRPSRHSIRPILTQLSTPHAGSRLAQIGPALLGASSFACADVSSKVVLVDGADVLTMSAVRAVLGVAMLFAWLKLVPPAVAFAPRAKWISLGLGLLFAGNVFLLFTAIETVEVPIAILTYFVYPLLTGLA